MLCNSDYRIIALKRKKSSLVNCENFIDKIIWVDTSEDDWKALVVSYHPQIIVHAAWIGVEASERNDWQKQSENLFFLNDLFEIALKSRTRKIIGLGSQAEYGYIDETVTELHPLEPTTAYGSVKIIISQLIKKFSEENAIEWYWLRVFSVYGEKESIKWLIPSVINKISTGIVDAMDFSGCEQRYAYLYVKDFAKAIKNIVVAEKNTCGVYNICSYRNEELRTIITYIKNNLKPSFGLNFGALPYRPNQSMLLAGDSTNLIKNFGEFEETSLEDGLNKVIHFYTSKIIQ
jgi:nucleoside-diphosphate-sugar epimerase